MNEKMNERMNERMNELYMVNFCQVSYFVEFSYLFPENHHAFQQENLCYISKQPVNIYLRTIQLFTEPVPGKTNEFS